MSVSSAVSTITQHRPQTEKFAIHTYAACLLQLQVRYCLSWEHLQNMYIEHTTNITIFLPLPEVHEDLNHVHYPYIYTYTRTNTQTELPAEA